jgi:hypothetical protein
MGDIGREQEEITFEPLPEVTPVETPVPQQEPVPAARSEIVAFHAGQWATLLAATVQS